MTDILIKKYKDSTETFSFRRLRQMCFLLRVKIQFEQTSKYVLNEYSDDAESLASPSKKHLTYREPSENAFSEKSHKK
ncbi:hypothetical protein P5673_007219 [Acropora cervicornis]|uniref:Uncharacterized protein n=1 Tax=Acropora cervicornis TaxID=6130 RepID=A0AAD9QW88_ACRCE|nr:hypothetical protein P5673_007219 [Acropora cervicornis]